MLPGRVRGSKRLDKMDFQRRRGAPLICSPSPETATICTASAGEPKIHGHSQVEQVWAYLRANFLSHRVLNSYDAIVGACCDAWNKLMSTPERLASITHRTWARAVSG